jgi:CBS domain-containing protein
VVVNDSGELVGVVTRWVLEQWAAQTTTDGQSPLLASVVHEPVLAYPDEPLRVVVNRMAETGRTDLPVVDRARPRALLGHITLHDMLKARVRHLEEEGRRERLLPISLIVPRWLRSMPGVPASGRLPVEGAGRDR